MTRQDHTEAGGNTVLYRSEGRLAYITLNRPDRLNTVNDQMDRELGEVFERYDLDDDAWVAIIHGAGAHFTAGADIRAWFEEGANGPDIEARSKREFHTMNRGPTSEGWLGRSANWKPVIAAVHGYCLGLGFGLALECDLVVATEDASFGIAETARGLSGGRVWARLQTFMPSKVATEILLTGDRVGAGDLHRQGLINRLVPPGEHVAAAEELAGRLLALPPLAIRSGVRVSRWMCLRNVIDADHYIQPLRLHQSEDFRESTQAFLEKRQPRYQGR